MSCDRVATLGDRAVDTATNELPPTTTVTSPTEHTTASETTTSAPPNPDEANELTSNTRTTRTSTTMSATGTTTSSRTTTEVPVSTTTTSPATAPTSISTPSTGPTTTSTAAPEIVIPDEPGTLAAAAQVAEVDTITAGESDLVVVDSDTVPTDARAGARALETWLDGGTLGTTWETFTSDDPDRDGWRWAAISQKTGTVVYIR